jgi:hypothetical protein
MEIGASQDSTRQQWNMRNVEVLPNNSMEPAHPAGLAPFARLSASAGRRINSRARASREGISIEVGRGQLGFSEFL